MKINRHAKILDLISRDDIETQEELAEKLNAEGFPVTQATVSRDIREMKLTKVTNDRGRQVYKVMQGTETGMNENISVSCGMALWRWIWHRIYWS